MGILERLAPGFAARRMEQRLQIEKLKLQEKMLQRYDAAISGGRHAGRARPATSASAEIQFGLLPLRNAARDLVRNNPHANRAMRVLRSHVAGEGMRPRAIFDDRIEAEEAKRLKAVARDQWSRFVENCDVEGRLDFFGQQRLGMGAVVESGEYLRIWFMIREKGTWFWRCRILEGDYLDHQRNEVLPNGGRIVQGVEFDRIGRRVAYWLHKTDPGDRFGVSLRSRMDVERIDAEFVDHVFEVLRPGQVRGVSWFAPVAVTLSDIDELAEAELVRKKLEACIAGIITNANEDGLGAPAAGISAARDDDGAPLKDAAGNPVERLQPGMFLQAKAGWNLEYQTPTASEGLAEHMRERLHAVAAGIGTTYSQMTGDLTGANFSSMRAGTLEFNRLVDGWQADLMVVQSGIPAWQRVMRLAVSQGRLPFVPRAAFTPPRRPWVDPLKDIKAAREEVEAGWASDQDMIERTGRDPEDVLRERREWQEMSADLGGAAVEGGPADE
jgi:lambda family phage portal protein